MAKQNKMHDNMCCNSTLKKGTFPPKILNYEIVHNTLCTFYNNPGIRSKHVAA